MIFLPLCVGIYFLLPTRWRWVFLLIASYYFYMCWRPEFALLMAGVSAFDFYAALRIDASSRTWVRRTWVALAVILNIGLLCLFKYLLFINATLISLDSSLDMLAPFPHLKTFLQQVGVPVGLSFFAFHSLSYVADVYFRKYPVERHLGYYLLFVAYFPQLVAGPIGRANPLLPELKDDYAFDAARCNSGLRMILWGMIKKVVIADNLTLVVDPAYLDPSRTNGLTLLAATYFFAIQIYCDFSGYTDIAIGSARIFGIELMKNFDRPYFSRSIGEFWTRWHISLSTWIRDYLYFPLGGNRKGKLRTLLNLAFVFLLSGLWHGANWTFVIWGGIHALFMCLSRITAWTAEALGLHGRWYHHNPIVIALRVLITFHIVLVAWVFFRAKTFSQATTVLHKIVFDLGGRLDRELVNYAQFRKCVWLIVAFLLVELVLETGKVQSQFFRWPRPVRWSVYYAGVLAVLTLGMFNHQEFIYFQF
jgi:D-alanyl-lipoteichoic acid acyltransferase DltB (MBOAT superfamily)